MSAVCRGQTGGTFKIGDIPRRFDNFGKGWASEDRGGERPQDGPKKTQTQRGTTEVAKIVDSPARFDYFCISPPIGGTLNHEQHS